MLLLLNLIFFCFSFKLIHKNFIFHKVLIFHILVMYILNTSSCAQYFYTGISFSSLSLNLAKSRLQPDSLSAPCLALISNCQTSTKCCNDKFSSQSSPLVSSQLSCLSFELSAIIILFILSMLGELSDLTCYHHPTFKTLI